MRERESERKSEIGRDSVCCREGQGISEWKSGWTGTSNENEGMVKDEKDGGEDEGKVEEEGLIGRMCCYSQKKEETWKI